MVRCCMSQRGVGEQGAVLKNQLGFEKQLCGKRIKEGVSMDNFIILEKKMFF